LVEAQLVRHLRRRHGVRQVLLVGKHQQHRLPELVFVEHAVHFVPGRVNAVAIVGVHYENQTLGVGVVVAPQRPNFVLASHVPHCKGNVFVFDLLSGKHRKGPCVS